MSDPHGELDIHPGLLVIGLAALAGVSRILSWAPVSIGNSASLGILFGTLVLVVLGWMKYIEVPPEQRMDDEFPRSYTREREFQGYEIEVRVEESAIHEQHPDHIHRVVRAMAFDDGELIATESNTAHAGKLPRTVFDNPIGEDGNGMAAGDQTRMVLEELYDAILEYDATGSAEDTAGVDSALDVVFGVEK